MLMDKFAGLLSSSARSMADSARNMELYAEVLDSQMETQNALFSTLIDKIDQLANKKGSTATGGDSAKQQSGNGGGLVSVIKGLATSGVDAAEGMLAFAKAAPLFNKGLKDFTSSMKTWNSLPSDIISGFTSSLNDLAKKFEEMKFDAIKKGADALSDMSTSIALFGFTLMVSSVAFAVVGPLAMLTVIPVIAGFSWVFSKIGEASESIDKGTKTVAWMGLAIVGMAAAMGLTMLLGGGSWESLAKGILVITTGMAAFGLVFNLIGAAGDNITKGAQAMAWTGIAIMSLGTGLALWELFGITFPSILAATAGVAMVGLAFALVGAASKYIAQGTLAVIGTGLALAMLAGGIGLFKLFNIGIVDIGITAAAVLGLGLAFAGVGMAGGFIALGAIAIMGTGVAMMVLSGGILLLNMTYRKAMSGLFAPSSIDGSRTNLSVMIDSIVDAFAINPLKSIAMAAGGIAIMSAAASMFVLSAGIWALQRHADSNLFLSDKDGTKLSVMIDSIVNSFAISPLRSVAMLAGAVGLVTASVAMLTISAGIWAIQRHVDSVLWKQATIRPSWAKGNITNIELMIGSIVDAFSINPLRSVAMVAGAIGLLTVSAAMLVLVPGIWALGKFADSVLWKPSLIKPAWAKGSMSNLELMIGSIVDAFAINPFKSAAMLASTVAFIGTTVAMLAISAGLVALNKLSDSALWRSASVKPSWASGNISNFELILGSIKNSMSLSLGEMANLGISTPIWLGIGHTIKNIGKGIADFVKIYETGINPKQLTNALDAVLKTVVDSLINNGPGVNPVKWLAMKSAVTAFKGVGSILTELADGIQHFATLKFPIYNADGSISSYLTLNDSVFADVSKNIRLMIGAVAGVLTEIGASQGEVGWFSKSKGEAGAAVVRGVGEDLMNIAKFVQMAASMKMPYIDPVTGEIVKNRFVEMTPNMLGPEGKVSQNIKGMIMAIAGALGEIGANPDAKSSWWGGKSNIEKGKAAILSVSGDMQKIAEAVISLTSIENMDKAREKITSTLGALPGIIIALGPAFIKALGPQKQMNRQFKDILGFVKTLSDHESPINSLSDSFTRLAESMGLFVDAYKEMDKAAMDKHKLLLDSLVVFSKIDPSALDTVSDKGKMLMDYIMAKDTAPAATNQTPEYVPEAAPSKQEQKGTTAVKDAPKPVADIQSMNTAQLEELLTGIQGVLVQIKNQLNGTLKVKDASIGGY